MQDALMSYFNGEKNAGLLIALIGAARFFSEESVRMMRVQRNFVIIQYVELAVIVLAAIVAFTQKNRFGIAGVALALLCHAAFLLAFDLIAERRGAVYLGAIEARGPAVEGRPAR